MMKSWYSQMNVALSNVAASCRLSQRDLGT